MTQKECDIIVYGASGFTGRLVAEYLAQRNMDGEAIKWAMAGRSEEKLAMVRDEIGAPSCTPLIVADANTPQSLKDMAMRTKVVLTTVGPFQFYGSALVAACAESGTDYVDLCGEPAWMREMIDAHELRATQTGARIVFSCGFDSIPFDLGVFVLQEESDQRFGAPCREIKARVRKMKGGFSGGTAASLKATMLAASKDPSLIRLLKTPFALTPDFQGPEQPSGSKPQFDDELGSWLAPFIMAPINTKNVHRSNFLMGHPYGDNFLYSEMLMTGPGDSGEKVAKAVAADQSLMSDDAPKPGEGPSKAERDAGYFDILFIGETEDGKIIKLGVTGDRDPGYGSTSKMIAEAALCLVRDRTNTPGGIWTPAAAMGGALRHRLADKAGLTFEIEK